MFQTVLVDHFYQNLDPLMEKIAGVSSVASVQYHAEEAFPEKLRQADALMIATQLPIDENFISQLARCKLICRGGVGYENIDVACATKRGIWVTNTPGYCDDEVSDHAMALLLALERRLMVSDADMRLRKQYGLKNLRGISGLQGKTAGIIGLGATGRLTAKKLTAFGMHIVYYHPRRCCNETGDGYIARWVELDELFRTSDYIILHATSTPETWHMVNARTLALMKPTAGVINVARGELIDTAALCDALREGHIACAGLDVFEGALQSEVNAPLFALRNVILTPHSAWLSANAERKLLEMTAQNICDAAVGRIPRNCVNFCAEM